MSTAPVNNTACFSTLRKLLCQCWHQHYIASGDTGYSNSGPSRSNRQHSHRGNNYNQGHGDGQGEEFIFDTGALRSPNTAVFDGENYYTGSILHYPASHNITPADLDTVDIGTTWILPEEVKNGEKFLAIGNPLHPLRANFTDPESSKKLLTDRFKYTLNKNQFFRHRVIDVGSKDRSKVKDVYERAIEQ